MIISSKIQTFSYNILLNRLALSVLVDSNQRNLEGQLRSLPTTRLNIRYFQIGFTNQCGSSNNSTTIGSAIMASIAVMNLIK